MDRIFSLALGKLIIAVAWADGKLHKAEISALKDELSSLPKISHEDWTVLKLYMEYPLSNGEIKYTLIDFKEKYNNPKERAIALDVLKRIIYADGEVDQKEIQLYREIVEFLEAKDNNTIHKLTSVFRGSRVPFMSAMEQNARGVNRERHLEDFMNNPIFFRFYRALQNNPVTTELPKDQLRKYCLAGGLLAKIAYSDHQIVEAEKTMMIQCLASCMSIDKETALSIVEQAISTDVSLLNTQRVCKQFNEMSSKEERENFLTLLVDVIQADNVICPREIMIFSEIGAHLRVSKKFVKQYIEQLKPKGVEE